MAHLTLPSLTVASRAQLRQAEPDHAVPRLTQPGHARPNLTEPRRGAPCFEPVKQCGHCHEVKPLDQFPRTADGFHTVCRACKSAAQRQRRARRSAGPIDAAPVKLPCVCWCEAIVITVSPADVRAGRTGSCGQPGCDAPESAAAAPCPATPGRA